MPIYRFYRIVSTGGPEEYIGSTTNTLSTRFSNHKYDYRRGHIVASSILFTKYGVETCSITLISEQEMEKADARREERRLIEECQTAVNRCRPILEKGEHKELCRKYDEEHRDENKQRCRKYDEEHRDAIRSKRAERISCDICQRVVRSGDIVKHKRTKICQSKK